MDSELHALAQAIRRRNQADEEIAGIMGRPAERGHVGEFIASRIFGVQLETSAVARGHDGRFREGPMAGATVNVKFYGKQESLLDIREDALPDYYLVLSGPRSQGGTSRGATRPILIEHVYLFHSPALVEQLRTRGVRLGTATSLARALWEAAEL